MHLEYMSHRRLLITFDVIRLTFTSPLSHTTDHPPPHDRERPRPRREAGPAGGQERGPVHGLAALLQAGAARQQLLQVYVIMCEGSTASA